MPADATAWPEVLHSLQSLYRQALRGPGDDLFASACDELRRPLALVSARWLRTHGDSHSEQLWSANLPRAGQTRLHRWQGETGAVHDSLELELIPGAVAAEPTLLDSVCHLLVDLQLIAAENAMLVEDAGAGDGTLGHAIVASGGQVIRANALFHQYLSKSEPSWDGSQLPFTLKWTAALARHGVSWQGLFFHVARDGDSYRLRVRDDRRLPEISPREYQVITLVASGRSFPEVARELGMAPSTASTHLYKVYGKLGISRRSELVSWLKSQADASRR